MSSDAVEPLLGYHSSVTGFLTTCSEPGDGQ